MPKPTRVLSHPPPDSGAYVGRWASGLEAAGLSVEPLTVRTLLGSRRSVVHIHWPEHLVRPGRPHEVAIRFARTAAMFVMMAIQGNAVAWTAHNLFPHSGWRRVDRLVAAMFHRVVDGVVVTTTAHVEIVKEEFPHLAGKAFDCITLVALDPGSAGERPSVRRSGPTRLLQFGTVAPYRGQTLIVEMIREQLEAGTCELTIVGRCPDPDFLRTLEKAAATLEGLMLRPEHVSDEDLRSYMLDADAVVGIQVEGLNTGSLPAALPLGVPVISADTPQAREIRDKLGHDWVFLLDDLENPACWAEAIEWAAGERPPMAKSLFDVEENGRLHLRFYESLSGAD